MFDEKIKSEQKYYVYLLVHPGTKKEGQTDTGSGFNGQLAPQSVRNLFLKKVVAHKKKCGTSNPLKYNL